jgi:hypothetical protein
MLCILNYDKRSFPDRNRLATLKKGKANSPPRLFYQLPYATFAYSPGKRESPCNMPFFCDTPI